METSKMYDCAIVGGGLAGLSLSILLANRGLRVILLEKNDYPQHKVCGEYISMEAWDFLERLGLPLSAMNLPRINSLRVSAPNGDSLQQQLPMGGFGISRYTLDEQLAQLAQQAGVELLSKTKVNDIIFNETHFEVITEGDLRLQALVAIGTFGKRTNIDTKWKRSFIASSATNYVGVKYHLALDSFPENLIELHNFADGYCGISRVDSGRVCMCYLTTAANLQRNGGSIATMEKNILYKNPCLKKYFEDSKFLYDKPLAISQISFEPKQAVERHVLMLGDAAGLIAPLCGNGMSMALRAAAIAEPLICDFIYQKTDRVSMERQYIRQWNSTFSARLMAGRTLQSLFGRPILTNWVIRLLKQIPFVVKKLIGLTHGQKF